MHEHILVFIKRSIWQLDIKYTKTFTRDLRQLQQVAWRDLVRAAVEQHGGQASLQDLYQTLDGAKKRSTTFTGANKYGQWYSAIPNLNVFKVAFTRLHSPKNLKTKKPPTDDTADGVALSHSQVKCTVSW